MIDYNCYCFDLDGTIYLGSNEIKGAVEAVKNLTSIGKKIFYLSNNSSKNKSDYVKRLAKIGLESKEEQIVLSSDSTIRFLKRTGVKRSLY
ncbi:hypothetical protein ACWAU3_08125 [Shewanella sp. JL219SE-S6]